MIRYPKRPHAVWLWLALPLLCGVCGELEQPQRAPLEAASTLDPAAVALLFGERLDPNHASSWDLQLLSGIGPARADAIFEHAHSHPYVALSDLAHVVGIGPKTIEKLSPWLEIASAVADRDASAQSPAEAMGRVEQSD